MTAIHGMEGNNIFFIAGSQALEECLREGDINLIDIHLTCIERGSGVNSMLHFHKNSLLVEFCNVFVAEHIET